MTFETIDLGAMQIGTLQDQKKVGEAIKNALERQGFLKLTNHGIAPEMIDELFAWSKQFFALPDEVKARAPHPPTPTPNRGYSAVGMENTSVHGNLGKKGGKVLPPLIDMKECFDQGAADDELYNNIWLPESDLPGFRTFMESYFEAGFACQQRILSAVALGLGLPPTAFDRLHHKRQNELRLTHYPPIEARQLQDGTKTRISEHTDFGTITLLFQDSVGGLEVEDHTSVGIFHPIESERYEMIVNIGDCFQRWSNGGLRSTRHRVHVSQRDLQNQSECLPGRYSVAYFTKPNRDASVGSMPELLKPGAQAIYSDLTAGEFVLQRSATTYGSYEGAGEKQTKL
ncbi:isopenicillin N synthase family dioxygenase [Aspergillus brunneoviolaceus CBS 621.78]|uniref:Clavaminate synthase-like protein n=1 Tax=Aspergillus brunneoviolaceus CBS 621.78 TaxID=1450534 RepID=A0ACD1GDN7_9EURO|nr:Clavaminate synthase-like protein [Aspergillus brunneoviolaceus CBS 621.78]RAH47394.1 Clavaminate synthase-like protein [Aspergillus brunneoviolaceus CBS 621.78]